MFGLKLHEKRIYLVLTHNQKYIHPFSKGLSSRDKRKEQIRRAVAE